MSRENPNMKLLRVTIHKDDYKRLLAIMSSNWPSEHNMRRILRLAIREFMDRHDKPV